MRRCWAIALLALSIASFCAQAEEPAQPVPADGKCAIPGDERWTPQEKFVWQQVCVGAEADFNKAAGYGGELDPKAPGGLPDNRILSSAFLETILLGDKYRRALTRLGVRIIGARFTETVNLDHAELGHDLWLDGSLLEKGASLVGLRSTRMLSLARSKVTGLLSMNTLQVGNLFMRNKAEFDDVDLGSAHVGGQLSLNGSKVTSRLNMNELHVDGPLLMADSAQFADVDLSNAHMGGQLSLIGSKVTGRLNMSGLQVGDLLMRDKAEFAEVDLTGAHVGGRLALVGSKVTGLLILNELHVDGPLEMLDRAGFAEVDLRNAHVGGRLSLSGSKVTGRLNMNGLQVGGPLLMGERTEFAAVDLTGAHVGGGQLNLDGAKVTGPLEMSGLQVGDLYMHGTFADVNLNTAHVGGLLSLNGSKVTGRLSMSELQVGGEIDLVGAKVTGPLDMYGLQVGGPLLMHGNAEFAAVDLVSAHVGGEVDLVGAKVTGQLEMNGFHGGRLNLAGSTVTGRFDCYGVDVVQDVDMSGAVLAGSIECRVAKIKGDLILSKGEFKRNVDLTGAEIGGALHLESAHWSPDATLTLRDAKIDRIPALDDAWPRKLVVEGLTYRIVGAAEQFEPWFRKLNQFAPQPYDQLASVVQTQGDGDLATAIRYFGREQERSAAKGGRWVWLTLLRSLIGYGYYPQRAIFWALGLVLAGALVMRISGEGLRNGMPYGVAYSFDVLLPIIRLRERHYQIDLQTWWARYYFYGHKIMGYVLASFLIAGLSGITK